MDKSILRKNILFSSHEISPYLGSECSSGWNLVLLLSKYHNLTVLYAETNQFNSENYREHIAKYFTQNEMPQGLLFIPVKQTSIGQIIAKVNQFISKKSSSTGFSTLYFLSYRLWQKSVFKAASKLIIENKHDLIHQFNSLSYREPGYLYKLNLPFIWGPISGLDNLPIGFFSNIPIRMLVSSLIRNISNYFQFKFSFRVLAALKKAVRVYAVTSTDKRLLSTRNNFVVNLLDVGANLKYSNIKERIFNGDRRLKIIWIGRLDYLKALDILLNAVSNSPLLQEKVEILIVGKGPQENYYKSIADKLKLSNLNWIGHVEKEKVELLMLDSDLLVHTSIKEAASAVILESLSCGLPIVCHNSFGMSHSITEHCGIMVDFRSTKDSILGFKSILEKIVLHPALISNLSNGAYKRAKELSWDTMAMKISDDYNIFAKKSHE
jgi:glycosyltransferase involved in cell wall biosynthesis